MVKFQVSLLPEFPPLSRQETFQTYNPRSNVSKGTALFVLFAAHTCFANLLYCWYTPSVHASIPSLSSVTLNTPVITWLVVV